MRVRFQVVSVFCVILMAAVCFMPAAEATKPIELSFASFLPTTTFCAIAMFHYKDEIEKRTNGRVKIITYPGGTLLGPKDMVDGVLTGQADIGDMVLAYHPGRFPVSNAMALPLGIPSAKAASRALWEIYEKYQPDELKGLKVLYMYTNTPSNLMTTFPVRTLEDLRGKSIRASGAAGTVLRLWGANYIGMPQSDVPEALQKKVIEGVFTSMEIMLDMNYAEFCKYITITEDVLYPFAVIMNEKSWDKLPKDIQLIFDGMRVEMSEWVGNYIDNHVMTSVGWSVVHQGVEAIQLSPAERKRFNERLEPMTREYIEEWGKKGLPMKEIVDDIRRFSKMYE